MVAQRDAGNAVTQLSAGSVSDCDRTTVGEAWGIGVVSRGVLGSRLQGDQVMTLFAMYKCEELGHACKLAEPLSRLNRRPDTRFTLGTQPCKRPRLLDYPLENLTMRLW